MASSQHMYVSKCYHLHNTIVLHHSQLRTLRAMKSVVLFWLSYSLLVVQAMPTPSETQEYAVRGISYGETPTDRTIYVGVSLFCTLVLSTLLGSRLNQLRNDVVRARHVTSMLVLLLHFFVIALIFSSAIMLSGQGLFNYNQCRAAIWICLVLYGAAKGVV